MNLPSLFRHRSRSSRIVALLCGFSLLFAGCVTKEQVATIVAESNAAIVTGQLGQLPAASGGAATQDWQKANEQIEAFIAAHSALTTVTAPLRVRQGMLLLANQQISLAQAAFDAAGEADLHTDRDRALKQNAAHLVWWFSHSTTATWTAEDQRQAQGALKDFAAAQKSLTSSPDIRDYLAEMRAWIGLASAKQVASTDGARTRLAEALTTYAETFSERDLEILQAGKEQLPDLKALNSDVRRRLRGRVVLTAAHAQNKADGLNAHVSNPVFDSLLNSNP